MTAPIPDLIFYGVASPSFVPSLSLYCPFSPPALLFTLLSLSAPYSSSQCRLPHCPPRGATSETKMPTSSSWSHAASWPLTDANFNNTGQQCTSDNMCCCMLRAVDRNGHIQFSFFFFRALVLFSLAISYDYTALNKWDYWDVRMWLPDFIWKRNWR